MNRCASQRRGPDRGSATRSLPGSWEEFHEIFALWTLNLVGTARCAVRAALSGAMMPPAASRAGTSQRDVPTKVRFMGSEHLQKLGVSCGHERWGETPSSPDLPT